MAIGQIHFLCQELIGTSFLVILPNPFKISPFRQKMVALHLLALLGLFHG